MSLVAHRTMPGYLFVGTIDQSGSVYSLGVVSVGDRILAINELDATVGESGLQSLLFRFILLFVLKSLC